MYLTIKLLHIAAVILFLCNIITGLFWHAHAARSREAALLAHAMQGIIRSDRLFTIPGVVVLVLAGLALAVLGHWPILRTRWIAGTLALLALSGLFFAFRVAPLQRRLLAMAADGARSGNFDYGRYRLLARDWELWGAAALLTPVAGLVLMVLKPAL